MDYKLAVVILTAVACFSLKDNSVLAQSECTLVENTSDKCHSANYIKILEQEVHKGMERRIKLPGRQREIRWLCGSSEERTAWDTPANQLRITYQSDGTVRWSVYDCPDLSGPTKAGLRCAVPETTEFCPKFNGANSSTCVSELKKSTSHVEQKTTTVSVTRTDSKRFFWSTRRSIAFHHQSKHLLVPTVSRNTPGVFLLRLHQQH